MKDEIYLGAKGLTSGYYSYNGVADIKRVIFPNIEEAKKAAISKKYDKFEVIYIRKVRART